jgi:hypothetical protein
MKPGFAPLILASALGVVGTGGVPVGAAAPSSAWTQISPASSFAVGDDASMAYDSGTDQVILFGGFNSAPTNETESWNGSTWEELTPADSPPVRYDASMAFDAATNQLLLFGGCGVAVSGGYCYLNDTWSWNGDNWTELDPADSPPAMGLASMAYDAKTERIILFGGAGPTASSGTFDDTWSWDGTNWTQLSPADSPPGRESASMAYDPAKGKRIILFGGAPGPLNDTWSWNGKNWSKINSVTSPSVRWSASMAYDAATKQVVLFGGCCTNGNNGSVLGDTWTLSGKKWTEQQPSASPPGRYNASMVADGVSGGVVLFGGWDGEGLTDTWTY